MMWLLFGYFATVSIVAGVLTVSLRNAVHCALALLTLLVDFGPKSAVAQERLYLSEQPREFDRLGVIIITTCL